MFFILEIFTTISNEDKGKVDVYFCGNSKFGKTVESKSIKHEFKFFKEYF